MSKHDSAYVAPSQQRHLRACMICSYVQPQQKFIKEGCPNCEDLIHLRNNPEKVEDCTSNVFEGLVTLWNPKDSWVARWQRVETFVRGMYAIKVVGNLPEDVIAQLQDDDVVYIPRDGSDTSRD